MYFEFVFSWWIVPVCTTFVCSQNSVVSQRFERLNGEPNLRVRAYEIHSSVLLRTNRISGQLYQRSPGRPRLVEFVWVLLKTKRIHRRMILRSGLTHKRQICQTPMVYNRKKFQGKKSQRRSKIDL